MPHILEFPKRHFTLIKIIVFVLCLTPFLNLLWDFYSDNLGINKLAHLTSSTGIWALNMQLFALAITPLRRCLTRLMIMLQLMYGKRLSDWNWIVKLRRMIGRYAFFYASIHLLIFIWFDQDLDWEGVYLETTEKPYMLLGMIAWLLLIPLAATSTDSAMRKLKKRWRSLHRSVYLIAIISVLHFLWLSKVGVYTAWWYIVIITFLLANRILFSLQKRSKSNRSNDDGMETPERPNRLLT